MQGVIFMLRKVSLPVMLIVDLSLARVVQHSPPCLHSSCLSDRWCRAGVCRTQMSITINSSTVLNPIQHMEKDYFNFEKHVFSW